MKRTLPVELGQVVTTAGVDGWMRTKPGRSELVLEALGRHSSGDWGEIDPEDRRANDESLASGGRLLSAYTVDGRKCWVITEWDRSVTTVLFPEEY